MKIKSKAHYRYTVSLTQDEVNVLIDELHNVRSVVGDSNTPSLHMLRDSLRLERSDRH